MNDTLPGLPAPILDSLRDIFLLVLDQEQRIVYANAAFLEHFGFGPGELLSQYCFDPVSPFTGTQATGSFCSGVSDLLYPERTLLKRVIQGQTCIYEATFYPLEDGPEGPYKVGVFRDVTQNYHLEQEFRKSFELERHLLQASMDGIIANDLEGNVLIFNQGASKILGYTPEEVIGKIKVSQLYPPNQAHTIKELIYDPSYGEAGVLENYETVVIQKDGTQVPIWLAARPLTHGGEVRGIVGYFRDLRERKRLEEELLRNERLATLGKMVAHVTHEIKNPLLVIGGFARQLERHQELDPEIRGRLTLIHTEVDRLEKFLGDLGSFTRIPPTQKVPGDLPALIREVADIMADNFKEKGITFHFEAPGDFHTFSFDPGQMRQVLINLFKNSLEAMSQGGLLTVGLQVRGEILEVTVQDTGQGISPENLKLLFTPFFSTKERGTGLGLTICRGLIEQHQGEISFASEVGRGTTCLIRLPLVLT
ncbi:MAG: PAS domain S-box protein [Syntrophales bacterium]|nr:PAS domain S-box protein [Syntrophales bacterium]MDD5640511.1 PAS domain S-box protein [Syntrophales bacterium]